MKRLQTMPTVIAHLFLAALSILPAACRESDARQTSPSSGPDMPAGPVRSAVYPQGELFPIMGYSGVPERDASHGFSVAGPSYTRNQKQALEAAEAAGLSYPYQVSIDMKFHAKAPEKPLALTEAEIKERITAQVREVVDRKSVCWWYLGPEELRPWKKNEMAYLKAATEAIRAADPLKRPIWMYDPNHRNAASLQDTGRHLDLIGKGFYNNLAGYQDHRIWIRWSMEQQTTAIAALEKEDGRKRIPLVLPELCADPADPADDHLIPRWVRHDVYLGLMMGGKGVVIWSFFPRAEVKRTWSIWYDAYSHLATELTGPTGLGQVFLRGTESSLLQIRILEGPKEIPLVKGARNKLESGTTTPDEQAEALVHYPSLAVTQLDYQGSTYVFLCNSSGTKTVKFQSTPFPVGSVVSERFSHRPYTNDRHLLYGWLGPQEVRCYRITKPAALDSPVAR